MAAEKNFAAPEIFLSTLPRRTPTPLEGWWCGNFSAALAEPLPHLKCGGAAVSIIDRIADLHELLRHAFFIQTFDDLERSGTDPHFEQGNDAGPVGSVVEIEVQSLCHSPADPVFGLWILPPLCQPG